MNQSAIAKGLQSKLGHALIESIGWTVQGRLGGHYRPIALVIPHATTWKSKVLLTLFRWTLVDRKRIHVILLPLNPSEDSLTNCLRKVQNECTWVACAGLDHRNRAVTVHRPFQFGPFPERESNYLLRYLGYFQGECITPPPTPAARAAEKEGY